MLEKLKTIESYGKLDVTVFEHFTSLIIDAAFDLLRVSYSMRGSL